MGTPFLVLSFRRFDHAGYLLYQLIYHSHSAIDPLQLQFTFYDLKVPKKLFQSQKIDFDQQTACGAPVRWSKYTKLSVSANMIEETTMST